jgi:hypothetical protein
MHFIDLRKKLGGFIDNPVYYSKLLLPLDGGGLTAAAAAVFGHMPIQGAKIS